MPISQLGALNTTALVVPNLYVQIVPPQNRLLNGVPTNIMGVVGTAQWGPVNSPVTIGSMADYARNFGAIQARKYDMGTVLAAAVLQGAGDFMCVRVTDGTDVAASAVVTQSGAASATPAAGGAAHVVNDLVTLTNGTVIKVLTVASGAIVTASIQTPGTWSTIPTAPVAQVSTTGVGTGATFNLFFTAGITLAAKYTGTLGNSLSVTVAAGSNSTSGAPTFKIIAQLPGQLAEIFDNIGGTGNALFVNMANAVNQGTSGIRGPSQIIVATAGAATGVPIIGAALLASGTDGVATITGATLVGLDTTPRKGMYALRSTAASIGVLADVDDTTTWSTQVAFGLAEGLYMILTGPAGDGIANAITAKQTAGIDSYAAKILFGDWIYYLDTANNGITRLISPQGFAAGRLSNLSPEQSSLNKQLFGIVGTQKSMSSQVYSNAELQQLALAGIDVITNPIPAGAMFGLRMGHNSSSNAVTNGDNYTRMTNYIASTLNAGMGIFIGELQTKQERLNAKGTIDNYCVAMKQQGMIDDFQTVLDDSNNPPNRVALGYQQADVKIRYLSIIEKFLVNVEGGQSVQIQRTSTQAA